jgi:conjugal transfer/entry exclusion protein
LFTNADPLSRYKSPTFTSQNPLTSVCLISMRWMLFLLFLTVTVALQGQSRDSLFTFSPDSLLSPYQHKLDSIQNTFYQRSDSLKVAFKRKLSILDSSRAPLQSKVDSLKNLQLPTEKYTHQLDSINQQRETLVASLNKKMEDLKSKTVGKITELSLPPELQEKVSAVTKNIEGFKLPVKDLNIPSLNSSDNPLKSLDGFASTFKSPLGNIGDLDGLKNIQENLGDISKITDQLSGHQDDLKNITQGNLSEVKQLPKTLEEKAADLAGLDAIKKQTEGIDPVLDAGKNPDALKEQATQQIQEIAVDHFAGKEQELQLAMEEMSKLKKKYTSLNSLTEIPKKRPNEMRNKPLIERLLPGIGIQLLKKSDKLLTDFNPYIGYRFTSRLTGGLGWNQRISYNFDKGIFNQREKIFGPRIFSEFKLGRGFSPRAELEMMNTFVPSVITPGVADAQGRQWVLGAFVGMKREYRFIKNVNGTAMAMLNVFNRDHRSPYADVLNVRFGFEFPMKKRIKKTE